MPVTKKSIEIKVWNLCLQKKKLKDYAAAVVGVIFNNSWAIDEQGRIPPPIAIQLKKRLIQLGPIGTELNGNIIGNCAEMCAANKILRTRPQLNTNRLKFTQAIRPRTMQKIAMCQNCLTTFR